MPAGDRTRLEHLCRYVLRPPIAQDTVVLAPDGRVRLELRRTWRDGTRALLFDPLDFLARLAALTPKPRVNLLLYHGVFGPHAARRRAAVANVQRAAGAAGEADGGSASGPRTSRSASTAVDEPRAAASQGPQERKHTGWIRWADLLRRVFEIDVLACARCGGRLRFVAAIDDPDVIRRILAHLGLATTIARPLPARPPPENRELAFDWA